MVTGGRGGAAYKGLEAAGAGRIRVSGGGRSADSHMLNPTQAPSSRHTGQGGSWQVLARIHPGAVLPPSLPHGPGPFCSGLSLQEPHSQGTLPLPTPPILFYCPVPLLFLKYKSDHNIPLMRIFNGSLVPSRPGLDS